QPPNLAPLPEAERAAIARALSKKPEDRFSTCMALVQSLERAGTARPAATPAAATPSIMDGGQSADAGAATQLTFATKCTSCAYSGRVPNKLRGRPVKCRQCGTVFTAEPMPEMRPPPAALNPPRPGPQTPPLTRTPPPLHARPAGGTPARIQDTQ